MSLRAGPLCVLTAALLIGCSPQSVDLGIHATYDTKTGRLSQLTYDSDNNGKPETWSYMNGAQLIRVEVDTDEDGLIDRWEYYGEGRKLEKVGMSRANDGIADSWAYAAEDGTISRLEISTARDGVVNRTEYFDSGNLVRAEEDTDRNGVVDKWETFRAGVLVSVAFDTEGAGVPTRRIVYGDDGRFERLESPGRADPPEAR